MPPDDDTLPTTGQNDTTPSPSVDTAASTPPDAATTTDAPAPSPGTDSTATPSSGDNPRETDRAGLLAAVKSVVAPEAKTNTPSTDQATDQDAGSGQATAQPGQADTGTTQEEPLDLNAPDPSEAELRKLRPETRKRFERLLAQRNEARNQLQALQPDLEQHRQLQGYLQQHSLAPDDVNSLLAIGAALRRQDYQGFLQGVTPYVMAAQEALGLRISADLNRQVQEGTLSEDAARELTRTRHQAKQAEENLRSTREAHTAQTTENAVAAVRHAVAQWETNIRATNPDYAQLSDAVRRHSQALIQEKGMPRTPAEAVALTQAAYDEVVGLAKRFRPPVQATPPRPSGVQSQTMNGAAGAPVPRSMLEAAQMASKAYRASQSR